MEEEREFERCSGSGFNACAGFGWGGVNDIPGFCIHRIPLCNLLSCTSSVKLSGVSQKILPVALLHDWKTKRKSIFLPEDKSHVTYLPTEPRRHKAHSASTGLLAQASSSGHGGWHGASQSVGGQSPGLLPPNLLPVLGDEQAPCHPCHPAPGRADPSTGSCPKQVGSGPSSPGQGSTPTSTLLPPAAPHAPEAGGAHPRALCESSAAGRAQGWQAPCGARERSSRCRCAGRPLGPPAPALPCLAHPWREVLAA